MQKNNLDVLSAVLLECDVKAYNGFRTRLTVI